MKLRGTAKLNAQGERVCLKDSKYILFEILENRTWKGRTSSCQPSKPDSAIWLTRKQVLDIAQRADLSQTVISGPGQDLDIPEILDNSTLFPMAISLRNAASR